jgi:hypothetical protein
MLKHLCCVVPLVLLSACATPTLQTPTSDSSAVAREADIQRQYVIKQFVNRQQMLSRVMYRLSTGATDLCGAHTGGEAGVVMMTAKGMDPPFHDAARAAFDLDDGFTIVDVEKDSPAALAGLQAGDHVVSVNGQPVVMSQAAAQATVALWKDAADRHTAIAVSVRRGGETLEKNVTPVRACYYPATLVENKDINAFADGQGIVVNSALMDFAHNDEELAVVLSHEFSHNILGHIEKKKQNALAGGALGLAADILFAATTGVNPGFTRAGASAGAAAYSVQFEQEADYEGMYLMQRAGYELDGAPDLWRRMAAVDPKAITLSTTHPTNPERFLALSTTIAEIRAKQTNGAPMVPNALPAADKPAR